MMKIQPAKQGFTLIELLTVIAIIGILASILIPTVGRVRESARRSVDASNIRQIGQASLIFANDNREALPWANINGINQQGLTRGGQTDVKHFAAALALQGGLNDAQIWTSGSDRAPANPQVLSTILNVNRDGLHPAWNAATFASFQAFAGLTLGMSSTTPIAVTRGIQPDGRWDATSGVYGSDGGHIVFLGGNVNFYRNLEGDTRLIHAGGGGDQGRTSNILQAVRQGTGDNAPRLVGLGPTPLMEGTATGAPGGR